MADKADSADIYSIRQRLRTTENNSSSRSVILWLPQNSSHKHWLDSIYNRMFKITKSKEERVKPQWI